MKLFEITEANLSTNFKTALKGGLFTGISQNKTSALLNGKIELFVTGMGWSGLVYFEGDRWIFSIQEGAISMEWDEQYHLEETESNSRGGE